MRRNGARIRVRDDPSKVRNEADSDIVAELKALTVGDESDIEDKLDARGDLSRQCGQRSIVAPSRGWTGRAKRAPPWHTVD